MTEKSMTQKGIKKQSTVSPKAFNLMTIQKRGAGKAEAGGRRGRGIETILKKTDRHAPLRSAVCRKISIGLGRKIVGGKEKGGRTHEKSLSRKGLLEASK